MNDLDLCYFMNDLNLCYIINDINNLLNGEM